MPRGIKLVDLGLAVWAAVWLVAATLVFESIKGLEEGGRAVATAGEGLDETSVALDRAAGGLQETGDALDLLDSLPLLPENPGGAVKQTAGDVERLADRVRVTGRDARVTGADAEDAAGTLAVVLGLAVALAPTLPVLLLYLLLRPVVAERVGTR